MDIYLKKQFELTRGNLLNEIDSLDHKVIDVIPDGFNNNIHWHIGHILTVTEQFLFGFPEKSQHIPTNYTQFFASGTKPADWSEEAPAIEELKEELRAQLDRIKDISSEQLEQKLDEPFLGQDTFGGLAAMSVFHEANHTGQLHAMNRSVKASL